MIPVVVVWLAMGSAAPEVLAGTDTLPAPAAVAAADVDALLVVVSDPAASVVTRARAARVLGGRPPDVASDERIEWSLARVFIDPATTPALRAQVLLARAEGAWRRGAMDVVARLATTALADPAPPVAVAGVLVWWSIGGPSGRLHVEEASRHDAPAVAGAARARLRHWDRAGHWSAPRVPGGGRAAAGADAMLDPTHGGPSPAR